MEKDDVKIGHLYYIRETPADAPIGASDGLNRDAARWCGAVTFREADSPFFWPSSGPGLWSKAEINRFWQPAPAIGSKVRRKGAPNDVRTVVFTDAAGIQLRDVVSSWASKHTPDAFFREFEAVPDATPAPAPTAPVFATGDHVRFRSISEMEAGIGMFAPLDGWAVTAILGNLVRIKHPAHGERECFPNRLELAPAPAKPALAVGQRWRQVKRHGAYGLEPIYGCETGKIEQIGADRVVIRWRPDGCAESFTRADFLARYEYVDGPAAPAYRVERVSFGGHEMPLRYPLDFFSPTGRIPYDRFDALSPFCYGTIDTNEPARAKAEAAEKARAKLLEAVDEFAGRDKDGEDSFTLALDLNDAIEALIKVHTKRPKAITVESARGTLESAIETFDGLEDEISPCAAVDPVIRAIDALIDACKAAI